MIFEFAIKEVISVTSSTNKLALDLIANLLYFLPLPHKSCLKDSYMKTMKTCKEKVMDYTDYLFSLSKKNENEYHYHELCNRMEDRLCELMSRILINLDMREKSNKDDIDEYAQFVLQFIENICLNLTENLFDVILEQVASFLRSGVHLNCYEEINMFLCLFSKRSPEKTAKAVVPHVLQLLIKKKTDTSMWKSVLGSYFQGISPELYEKAIQYSINSCISKDHFNYYCNLLFPIIS